MTVLRPHLALDVIETLWSFACRLAAFHVGGSLSMLLADLGIDLAALHLGRTEDVRRLAEAAGVDPIALLRATIRITDRRSYLFRGEAYSHDFIGGAGLRVCPLCLAGDEEADPDLPEAATWRLRISWRFRPVICCPTHEVELLHLERHGGSREMAEVRRYIEAAGGAPALLACLRPRAPSSLQLWVQDRLDGGDGSGGPWLAGQTIEQGARACEMLGAQILFGGRRNVGSGRSMSPADWEEAGACGLEIAKGGPEAIRSVLDDMHQRAYGAGVQAGGDRVYGLLFSWLDHRSPLVDPGPIRDLLREHILGHVAFAPGERVLGEPVLERQMHSIRSLGEVLQLPSSEVVRRLVRLGWMPADLEPVAAARLAFPAETAERKCRAIAQCVLPQITASLLGCTLEQLDSLAAAGVLEPILDHGPAGQSRSTKYSSEDAIGLLRRLKTMAARVQDTSGMIGFEEAATRTGITFGEQVALVLEGKPGHVAWTGFGTGLGAVRLRQADLLGRSKTTEAQPRASTPSV